MKSIKVTELIMTKLQRIMYVEDESDIQTIVKIALEEMGSFDLQVYSSGEEALAGAADFLPDLLLLDVMMPGMNGPDTLKALRQIPQLKDTPVMFMTAKVQDVEIKELIDLGALEVIPKPFNPVTLADEIRGIWKKYTG